LILALICALNYLGLRTDFNSKTATKVNAYSDIGILAPHAANVTITLP
jgi:type VI secretion system protein ImpK